MRRNWFIAALILGLALVANSGAEAVVQTGCGATNPGEFIVPTDGLINGGYNNTACILTINAGTTVTPDLQNWAADAMKIHINGTAGSPVSIINTAVNSKLTFDANNGDIRIAFATIKARSAVNFFCTGTDTDPPPLHNCRVDIDDSTVIAAKSLDVFKIPGDPGSGFSTDGNLNISAVGEIDLQRSTVWGGSGLHMKSSQGGITFFCPGGGSVGVCTDPLLPALGNPPVVNQLCGTPPVFPCTVVFNDAAAVHNVCFPQVPGGALCGGGNTEARFAAFLDIDISGSTFTFLNHVTFSSVKGGLKAGPKGGLPSKITSDSNLFVDVNTTIDVTDAEWTVGGSLKLSADCVGVPPGGVPPEGACIRAVGADMESKFNMQFTAQSNNGLIITCEGVFDKLGSGFPKINGGSVPFAYPNTIDDVAECGALVPPLGPAIYN